MKFCPQCQARLKRNLSVLKCTSCQYQEDIAEPQDAPDDAYTDPELTVFDDTDDKKNLPTITIDCIKCDNKEAIWWMMQTRSADEPTTRFYRCTECKHTWRDYS